MRIRPFLQGRLHLKQETAFNLLASHSMSLLCCSVLAHNRQNGSMICCCPMRNDIYLQLLCLCVHRSLPLLALARTLLQDTNSRSHAPNNADLSSNHKVLGVLWDPVHRVESGCNTWGAPCSDMTSPVSGVVTSLSFVLS